MENQQRTACVSVTREHEDGQSCHETEQLCNFNINSKKLDELFLPIVWLVFGFDVWIFKLPIMIIADIDKIHPTNCYWSVHKDAQQFADDW